MTWVLLVFLVGILGFGMVQMSREVHAIEGDVVQRALQRGKPTIAEFGSDTCATCRQMTVLLKQLAAKHSDKLSVAMINIYKEPDYTKRYRIILMPTQVFFDANGNEIGRHMGALTEQEILEALNIQVGGS